MGRVRLHRDHAQRGAINPSVPFLDGKRATYTQGYSSLSVPYSGDQKRDLATVVARTRVHLFIAPSFRLAEDQKEWSARQCPSLESQRIASRLNRADEVPFLPER